MPLSSPSDPPAPTFELPPAWETGACELVEPIGEADLPGGVAHLEMAALRDGTHVVALTWPAGQRLARTGPATGWSVHEHFSGDPPRRGEEVVDRIWSRAVGALVDALRGSRRSLEG